MNVKSFLSLKNNVFHYILALAEPEEGDDDVFVNTDNLLLDIEEASDKRRTQSLSALPKDELKSPKKVV